MPEMGGVQGATDEFGVEQIAIGELRRFHLAIDEQSLGQIGFGEARAGEVATDKYAAGKIGQSCTRKNDTFRPGKRKISVATSMTTDFIIGRQDKHCSYHYMGRISAPDAHMGQSALFAKSENGNVSISSSFCHGMLILWGWGWHVPAG